MTSCVIDASSTLAWCFEDESDERADALLERVATDGAVVPVHWRIEVASALIAGERRGRLRQAETAAFIGLIEGLPIVVDETGENRAFHDVLALARQHRFSCYDAGYFELAMRLGLPLASRDRALINTARASGVSIMEDELP